jgi:alpha-mannosidase
MIDFIYHRIERICENLEHLVFSDKISVKDILIKEGDFLNIKEVNADTKAWEKFAQSDKIGGVNYHAWFRADIVIPRQMAGKRVVIRLLTDSLRAGWAIWSSIRPQFLVFVNGVAVQGSDFNHTEITLTTNAKAGAKYRIDFPVFNGFVNQEGKLAVESDLLVELVSIDKKIRDLYFDIKTPLMVAEKLEPSDKARVDILNALTSAIGLLDLRKPYSNEFYRSVDKTTEYLKTSFYDSVCGSSGITNTYAGSTHIDVTWLWDLAQTRKKAVRSFATAVNLMDEYPEYIFLCGQPQLYKYVKEDLPEVYQHIKEKVKNGQWEIEGSMWVEAECTVASGETMVRQIMFGKRFFREEFQKECRVFWAPDVFGFNAALPQILKKSGVDYFTTTKITWHRFNKPPYDTFMWKGIDGTEILSYFPTTLDVDDMAKTFRTTYNGMMTPGETIGAWKRYQQKEINSHLFGSYGYGDGGGGPTFEQIERMKRMSKGIPGCPQAISGGVLKFFMDLEKRVSKDKRLPVWEDELLMESHYGIFASMGMTKKLHRQSELIMRDAEFLASLTSSGTDYPQEEINNDWEVILLNGNCDTLSGASIHEVYVEANESYKKVIKSAQKIVDKSLISLGKQIKLNASSVVIYNTLSYNRSDMVALDISTNKEIISIINENGILIPSQKIGKNLFFYVENIPAMGYKTYRIGTGKAVRESALVVNKNSLENDFFRVKIDKDGCFSSIYDKRSGRETIRKGQRGNLLLAFEDKPLMYDNYIIEIYYKDKMWEITQVDKIEVIEEGDLRAGIRITRRFLDSTIIQNVYIYRNIDRIDIETDIDWNEQQILLKAAFPVDVHTKTATYDIQYGNIERATHNNTPFDTAKFEVPGHKWVDLSEADFGLSVLNDCKYGYDIKNGTIRITLIKSGTSPNLKGDMGKHHFVYSIYPHKGTWREADTAKKAYNLNVPLYARIEKAHNGFRNTEYSFVQVSHDNVLIEVVKKAEVGSETIIRLYEYKNKRNEIELTFAEKLESVVECDLMENKVSSVKQNTNKLKLLIKPYEIITLKVKFKWQCPIFENGDENV